MQTHSSFTVLPGLTLLGLTLTSPALAQTAAPADEPPPVREVAPATAEDPDASAASAQAEQDAYARASNKEVSMYFGSPIWLSGAPVDPGFEVEARSGVKFGVVVPEAALGLRWNWLNVDKLRQTAPGVVYPERYQGENLNAVWFSLGLRFEAKERRSIMPYGSVAFDFDFWSASTDTSDLCGVWTCAITDAVQFAPGFSGRAGVRFKAGPTWGLDVGAKLGMTFPGWAFSSSHSWLEPYVGFTFFPGG